MYHKNIKNQKGYTLLEVVISVAVATMVISALTFATISSLRNAQLAKRQSQATKYAQEGLERVRGIRDRNDPNSIAGIGAPCPATCTFSDLWNIDMSLNVCPSGGNPGACYFKLSATGDVLTLTTVTDLEKIANTTAFERQIQITDNQSSDANPYTQEKQVTSVVKWSDFSGQHESKLSTFLRKL